MSDSGGSSGSKQDKLEDKIHKMSSAVALENTAVDRNIRDDTKSAKKEDDALFRNNQRNEQTRSTFHKLFIWGLWSAGIALIALFLVRFWHFMAPSGCSDSIAQCCVLMVENKAGCRNWRWLSSQELQEIDRILFSGALGALLSRYLGPILNNGKEK